MKKYQSVFILVRVVVESSHDNISDTVNDLETKSKLDLASTEKVKVLETEILLTRVRNMNNINNGTPS